MSESTDYQPPANGWRTFLIVWVTQSMSVIGSALTGFAITIWLTTGLYPDPSQKAQLAWALSALNLSFAIPVVFGAPIAGAFVDRHDRKRTMMVMDCANGCISLLTLALIATRQLNVFWLVVIGVLSSTCTAFHNAAFDTSYAMLVPKDRLPRANGMMQTIWALSGVLAPSVAATLITLPALARNGQLPAFMTLLGGIPDGTLLAIGVDSLSFFLAALVPLFLFIPSPKRTDLVVRNAATGDGHKKSLWADVREGALYIWHRRSFLWLLGTFTVANFAGGAQILQPLILKFQLAADWTARGFSFETALALLTTAASIGGVLGGVFISVWGGLKVRRVFGVLVPLIIEGLALVMFGQSRLLLLAAAAVAVSAAMNPILNAHSQSIWQAQTPHELQGRVFSVRRLIAQFSWPASSFLMGLLASRFDPGPIVIVLGLILACWCIAGLFNPYLRRVEDKPWIEAQALKYAQVSSSHQRPISNP
ncbi:MAG: MFS transporter [Chloroflexi bacterium]|nr:MFS transporter [Chloroflexota bacterium]